MYKKIILFITLITFLIPTSLHADNEVSSLAQNWFTTFSNKIKIKYSSEKEILYFESFSKRLEDLLATRDFNEVQIDLVEDLIKLSNEFVFTHKRYKEEIGTKIILKSNPILKDFRFFSYNKEHIFLDN
jgi:predicted enzyme involved in methoxymalonyl-ACP biosynthesis